MESITRDVPEGAQVRYAAMPTRAATRGRGEIDFLAQDRSRGTRLRVCTLVMAAMVSALTMAMAAPASATSYGAIAWGYNGEVYGKGSGQLGDGNTLNTDVPVTAIGVSGVRAVSAGGFDSMALLNDGTVMSWGAGAGTSNSDVPQTLSGLSGVTAISAGYGQNLALLEGGSVVEWDGYVGTPTPVSGLSGVAAISAGPFYNLALLEGGTVMAWGQGYTEAPTAKSGLSGVSAVSAGAGASLALLKGGTVMQWLGAGAPTPVSGLAGVTAVAAGWQDNLAVLSDGTVMEWSGSGPAKHVSGLSGVTAVAVGHAHNLALLSDGTIMAWGENLDGQLGNGTTTSSSTPVAVSGPDEAAGISAGYEHSLAYGPPLPTVIHVNPNTGAASGGTPVTISGPSGTDYTGTTAVMFGSSPAASFTVDSPTSISAVSPEGASTLDVRVTTAAGTSPPIMYDQFTYVPAGLPELGRCQKVVGVKEGRTTVYHGADENSSCTKISATKTGKYEWAAGPGPGSKFTATIEAATVEYLGRFTVRSATTFSCTGGKYEGNYSGPKTLLANVTFTGCARVASKASCQSEGAAPGEIKEYALEGELGLIKGGTTPSVGLDLRPTGLSAPNLAAFECGGSAGTLEGSVIAPLSVKDAMAISFALRYKGPKGVQSPEKFESALKDTMFGGEPAGLTTKVTITNEERFEIKAIA
jgi:Regulator of chromosome condensation (RCC1) repeat